MGFCDDKMQEPPALDCLPHAGEIVAGFYVAWEPINGDKVWHTYTSYTLELQPLISIQQVPDLLNSRLLVRAQSSKVIYQKSSPQYKILAGVSTLFYTAISISGTLPMNWAPYASFAWVQSVFSMIEWVYVVKIQYNSSLLLLTDCVAIYL